MRTSCLVSFSVTQFGTNEAASFAARTIRLPRTIDASDSDMGLVVTFHPYPMVGFPLTIEPRFMGSPVASSYKKARNPSSSFKDFSMRSRFTARFPGRHGECSCRTLRFQARSITSPDTTSPRSQRRPLELSALRLSGNTGELQRMASQPTESSQGCSTSQFQEVSCSYHQLRPVRSGVARSQRQGLSPKPSGKQVRQNLGGA